MLSKRDRWLKVKRKLKTKITKILWEYGLNPRTFCIFVYDDDSKEYLWNGYKYSRNFIDSNDYWFKFYWNFVRTPKIRTGRYAAPSDRYEIYIEKFDTTTGKRIKHWNTMKC